MPPAEPPMPFVKPDLAAVASAVPSHLSHLPGGVLKRCARLGRAGASRDPPLRSPPRPRALHARALSPPDPFQPPWPTPPTHEPGAPRRWQDRPKPQLHARAYLRLGLYKWHIHDAGLDGPTISRCLGLLGSATEYGANWAKAWHNWSLFNCGVLESLARAGEPEAAAQYVAPAVQGFFRRCGAGPGATGLPGAGQRANAAQPASRAARGARRSPRLA
jgi:hypothetical protein